MDVPAFIRDSPRYTPEAPAKPPGGEDTRQAQASPKWLRGLKEQAGARGAPTALPTAAAGEATAGREGVKSWLTTLAGEASTATASVGDNGKQAEVIRSEKEVKGPPAWLGLLPEPQPPSPALPENGRGETSSPVGDAKQEPTWPAGVAVPDLRPIDKIETMNIVSTGEPPVAQGETGGYTTLASIVTPDFNAFNTRLVDLGFNEKVANLIRDRLSNRRPGDQGEIIDFMTRMVKSRNIEDPAQIGATVAELLLLHPPPPTKPVTELTDTSKAGKERSVNLAPNIVLSLVGGDDVITADGRKLKSVEHRLGLAEDGKTTAEGVIADLLQITEREAVNLDELTTKCSSIRDQETNLASERQIARMAGEKDVREKFEAELTARKAKIEEYRPEAERWQRVIDEIDDVVSRLDERSRSEYLRMNKNRRAYAVERMSRAETRLSGAEAELNKTLELADQRIQATNVLAVESAVDQMQATHELALRETRRKLGVTRKTYESFKLDGFKGISGQVDRIKADLAKWHQLTSPDTRGAIIQNIAELELRLTQEQATIETALAKFPPKSQGKEAKELRQKLADVKRRRIDEPSSLRRDLLPSISDLGRDTVLGTLYADMVVGTVHLVKDQEDRVRTVTKDGLIKLANFSTLEAEIQTKIAELKAKPVQPESASV